MLCTIQESVPDSKIVDKINLFFMAKNIYFSKKEDFQFKVGLGYKFK